MQSRFFAVVLFTFVLTLLAEVRGQTPATSPAAIDDGAPGGTKLEAEDHLSSDSEAIDDPAASGGRAVTNSHDWHPLMQVTVPAEGTEWTVWVRHRGGPLLLKSITSGNQTELKSLWAKPATWAWSSAGRYKRADLGDALLLIRGAGGAAPAVDEIVLSPDAKAVPTGPRADLRLLPPFEPDEHALAQNVSVAIDWDKPAGAMPASIWGVNDYESLNPKSAGDPEFQAFLTSLHPALIRIHNGALSDLWTDPATRAWDVSKIRAGLDASIGYGNAKIMLNIPSWPKWMDDPAAKGVLPLEHHDEFVALVGSLVRAMRDEVKHPVAYWELLNEKDGAYERAGKLDELWKLHNRLFAEIHKQDPSAKVGGAAFTWPKPVWVDGFLAECGPSIDFVTWHNYGTGDVYDSNEDLFAATDRILSNAQYPVHAVATALKGKHVEMFLSEYNVKWIWNPIERRHANNVGAVFQAMVLKRMAMLGLDGVAVWHAKGNAYGLIDANDHIRLTGRLYQLGSRCLVGTIATATSGDEKSLEVLAITRADAVRSILLINRSDHTVIVPLVPALIPSGGTPTVARIEAKGASSPDWEAESGPGSLSLRGYSLTLITSDRQVIVDVASTNAP